MSESSSVIFSVIFGLIFVLFVYLIWFTRFKRTTKRIADTRQNQAGELPAYRARYENDTLMGELYISKDRIWYEKAGLKTFDVSHIEIEKIIYNKRSVQILLKNGQSHALRYLHLSAEKERAINYWVFYSVMYNDKEALQSLLSQLRRLNIQVEEGPTGRESPYFYFSIACALFAFSFIAIMAIAKFIFGLNTFLGINL